MRRILPASFAVFRFLLLFFSRDSRVCSSRFCSLSLSLPGAIERPPLSTVLFQRGNLCCVDPLSPFPPSSFCSSMCHFMCHLCAFSRLHFVHSRRLQASHILFQTVHRQEPSQLLASETEKKSWMTALAEKISDGVKSRPP